MNSARRTMEPAMNSFHPRNDDAENLLILVRQLREQGCVFAARTLRSGKMEWKKDEERKGLTLLFTIDEEKELLPTRKVDLWKAVSQVVPRTLRVTSIVVRAGEGDRANEERASLLDDESDILTALREECAGRRDATLTRILNRARIEISWDRIGKRAVLTLCTSPEGYAALEEDDESTIPLSYRPWFQLEMAIKNILGEEITVRFAEDTASKEPIDDPTEAGLNNCFFKTEKTIAHDDLRFRSPAEIAIYDELSRRPLLFFPNAAAVLGGAKKVKREPDFLICQEGKWGILGLPHE
jgi:hypothetical protein